MRVLDLFCGAVGGWSIGLHRAGYRTVAACEIEPDRRAAFSTSFPDAVMFEDVRDVSAQSLRSALGSLPTVVVGSPPCQDHSSANRKGRGLDGERGSLVLEWCRVVREVRPRWAAFENSPRLRAAGADRVVAEMAAIGYACWPHVVGARDVGARHHRERLFLVAADPYALDLREQPRRSCWAPGPAGALELVERHPSDLDADRDDEHGQPEHEEMAGLVGAVDRLLGPAWVRGARRLLGLLRLAHGAEPGLARALAGAIGDAVHPDITAGIGRAMNQLTAGKA